MNDFWMYIITIGALTLLLGGCVQQSSSAPAKCKTTALSNTLQALCEVSDSSFIEQAKSYNVAAVDKNIAVLIHTKRAPSDEEINILSEEIEITYLSKQHNSIGGLISTSNQIAFLSQQQYIIRVESEAIRRTRTPATLNKDKR